MVDVINILNRLAKIRVYGVRQPITRLDLIKKLRLFIFKKFLVCFTIQTDRNVFDVLKKIGVFFFIILFKHSVDVPSFSY